MSEISCKRKFAGSDLRPHAGSCRQVRNDRCCQATGSILSGWHPWFVLGAESPACGFLFTLIDFVELLERMSTFINLARRLHIGSFLIFTLAVAGCGGGAGLPGETGTVSGKLTYNGQPLPVGASVVFMHKEQGFVATGPLGPDGSFTLQMRDEPRILVGEYAVSVSAPAPAENVDDNMTAPPPKEKPAGWTALPEKFQSPETSGQTFLVKTGSNTANLDLKD